MRSKAGSCQYRPLVELRCNLSRAPLPKPFRPIPDAVAGGRAQLLGGGVPLTMAGELEGSKSLSGLLSGLAQEAFHGHQGITEELLRSQLYPEVSLEEFRPFLAKMRGILKVPVVPAAAAAEPNPFPSALRLGSPKGEKAVLLIPRLRGLYICSFRSGALAPSPPLTFLRVTPFCPSSQPRSRYEPERTLGFSSTFSLLLCGQQFRVASAGLCAPD